MEAEESENKLKEKEREVKTLKESQAKAIEDWEAKFEQATEKVSKLEIDLALLTEKLVSTEYEKNQAEQSVKEEAAKIAETSVKKEALDKVQNASNKLFTFYALIIIWYCWSSDLSLGNQLVPIG